MDHLNPVEIRRLLEASDDGSKRGIRNYALIALMAVVGLRPIDIHRLGASDIDMAESVIYLRGPADESLSAILPAGVARAVRTWLSTRILLGIDDPALFVSMHWSKGKSAWGSRLSVRGVRCIVDRHLELIGVKRPGLSCQALRRSALINGLANGADTMGVRSMFGISAQTVRAYQRTAEMILGNHNGVD
jgi:integrase